MINIVSAGKIALYKLGVIQLNMSTFSGKGASEVCSSEKIFFKWCILTHFRILFRYNF